MATINLGSVKKGFPDLFGQGADLITGGRGRAKGFITSLSNSSSSTFVAASGGVEAHYVGTFSGLWNNDNVGHIIPYVSGNVNNLNYSLDGGGGSTAEDNKSYHGHLAPAGGLAITNGRFLLKNMDNIIIRYLTVRGTEGGPDGIFDSMEFGNMQKFGVDHCSPAWTDDEAISVVPGPSGTINDNIILQRILVGETNQRNGNSKGMLLGSSSSTYGYMKVNVHLNAFNCTHRTPILGATNANAELRAYNNIVYNWRGRAVIVTGIGEKVDAAYYYYKHNKNTSQYHTDLPFGYDMINMPILAFNESTDTASIFAKGNIIENTFTDPNANNQILWTRWADGNATPLQSKNFRSTMLPVQANVGYNPVSALLAKLSVIDNKEVGNNRSTDVNGNIVFGHDNIDAFYFSAWNAGIAAQTPESAWIHPTRPFSSNHQTDTSMNGIYDGFETENGLGLSTESEASYTWKGDTYLNPAGYDNFEVWSAIQGGVKSIFNTPTIPGGSDGFIRSKQGNILFINR